MFRKGKGIAGRANQPTESQPLFIRLTVTYDKSPCDGCSIEGSKVSSDLSVDIQEGLPSTNNDVFKQELSIHVAWCLQPTFLS